jgi:hypothetical protein
MLWRVLVGRLVRNYQGAKLVGHFNLWRQRRGRPRPVLVHQMGKVASQAVARSLEAAGLGVYQIHYVTGSGLTHAEGIYRGNWDANRGGPLHVWQGQWVHKQLTRRPTERWQVITVVRDPVARNVSAFFQVADMQFHVDVDGLASGADDDDDAMRVLRQAFLDTGDEHNVPLRWLDDELGGPFGIDVYAEPFPRDRGWTTYRGKRADVLLIRYEDLGRCFAAALEEFLGLPSVKLARTNVSSAKTYGRAYDVVSRRLTLPNDYLNHMYGSRYAQHFYSEAEIAGMRARWEPS